MAISTIPIFCYGEVEAAEDYFSKGKVSDPWGFEITLPKHLQGHHNSPPGIQGHGMTIPTDFAEKKQIGHIELFAGYNGANRPDPACAAHEILKYRKYQKVLSSGPITVCGFDGWRTYGIRETETGMKFCEEVFLLRGKDKNGQVVESHYSKMLLKHSFEYGCNDIVTEAPYLEYQLIVEAPSKVFELRRKEFWELLKSWKFILAEN